MDKAQSKQLVLMLFSAYPQGVNQAAGTMNLYEAKLMELPFEQAKKAVWYLIDSTRYLPTVAEIRQVCGMKPEVPPGLVAHLAFGEKPPPASEPERPERTMFRPKPIEVAPVGTAGEASAKLMASLRNRA